MKKYVKSSSDSNSLLDEFMRYHEDPDNYEKNRDGFDKMYDILDKYGTENENVDEVFVRAPENVQKRLVDLIRPKDNIYAEDINIQSFDLDSIMKDKVQRRIYGKMLNLVDDAVEPWLQGVLDLAEVSGMNIPGIVNIWNAIQEHGVEAVKEVLHRK